MRLVTVSKDALTFSTSETAAVPLTLHVTVGGLTAPSQLGSTVS
jgi:hypothetical protein